MFCKNCGAEMADGSTFCPMCGSTVASENAAPVNPVSNTVVPPVGVNAPAAGSVPPMPVNRSWWKMLLLGLITLGIYPLIVQDKMVHELNVIAYKRDGWMMLSPAAITPLVTLTLSIYYFYYQHKYMNRLGEELRCRGIGYSIGAVHFWLLGVLFSFTIVCPIVLLHKICKAQNLLNEDYNRKGM